MIVIIERFICRILLNIIGFLVFFDQNQFLINVYSWLHDSLAAQQNNYT
jgi:hypothetical protein